MGKTDRTEVAESSNDNHACYKMTLHRMKWLAIDHNAAKSYEAVGEGNSTGRAASVDSASPRPAASKGCSSTPQHRLHMTDSSKA